MLSGDEKFCLLANKLDHKYLDEKPVYEEGIDAVAAEEAATLKRQSRDRTEDLIQDQVRKLHFRKSLFPMITFITEGLLSISIAAG